MEWHVKFSQAADKQLAKLDRMAARRIVRYMEELVTSGRIRDAGKPLKGTLSDFWRYRVGSYRILCQIEDREMLVLVVEVGHRQGVYD